MIEADFLLLIYSLPNLLSRVFGHNLIIDSPSSKSLVRFRTLTAQVEVHLILYVFLESRTYVEHVQCVCSYCEPS